MQHCFPTSLFPTNIRKPQPTRPVYYFPRSIHPFSGISFGSSLVENLAEKLAHDEIVRLVEKMLKLQRERQSVRRADDLDRVRNLEKQIAQVDAEIDQRVYALYGITEEEIKIVEGA